MYAAPILGQSAPSLPLLNPPCPVQSGVIKGKHLSLRHLPRSPSAILILSSHITHQDKKPIIYHSQDTTLESLFCFLSRNRVLVVVEPVSVFYRPSMALGRSRHSTDPLGIRRLGYVFFPSSASEAPQTPR